MISRITVSLEQPEYSGLLKMAVNELRTPPDQLRHILRQELERLGYLSASGIADDLDRQSREVHHG
jgi:hypothetical protein